MALAPEASAAVKSAPAHVVVESPELASRISGSNIAGAGIAACSAVPGGFLVGAIIGAATAGADAAIENKQAKTAEALITPLRDVLLDFDVPEAITVAVRNAVADDPHFSAELVVLDRQYPGEKGALKTLVESAPGKTLLLLRVDYYLTSDFGAMRVDAVVDLLTADPTLKKHATRRFLPVPSLYHNYLAYSQMLPVVSRTKETNAAAWAEKGAALKTELEAAIAELAAMLVYDLRQPATVTDGAPFDEKVIVPMAAGNGMVVQGGTVAVKGRTERSSGSRRWVRVRSGELYSLE